MQLDKNKKNKYIKIRIKKLKSFSDISYKTLKDIKKRKEYKKDSRLNFLKSFRQTSKEST